MNQACGAGPQDRNAVRTAGSDNRGCAPVWGRLRNKWKEVEYDHTREEHQDFYRKLQSQPGEGHLSGAGVPLGNSEVGSFADGENFASIYETVRGADVFVVQSTCPFEKDGRLHTVNDSLMELLIMIDALRRASAGRITAVVPYFGYARQDRKTKPRDPISAKLVANILTRAGADRVLTMDLHANQIQGFFDIPVDNLLGSPIFVNEFIRKFAAVQDETMVVSPDVGSVARARAFAQKLGMPLAIVDKRRQKANSSEVMNIIGDVTDKHVILLDDMVDTGGSLCHAAKALVDIGKAKSVTACATHGLLSGPAIQRIADSVIDEVVFLDTIPPRPVSPPARRSVTSPWPTCLPRPSATSTRRLPSPVCSPEYHPAEPEGTGVARLLLF